MKPAGREGGHGGVGPDIVPVIFLGLPPVSFLGEIYGQRAPSSEARSAHTNGRRSGLQSREPSAPPPSAARACPAVFSSANIGVCRAHSIASARCAGIKRSGPLRPRRMPWPWPPAMQPWSAPRSSRSATAARICRGGRLALAGKGSTHGGVRHECRIGSTARPSTPARQRENAVSCRIEAEAIADAQTTRCGHSVV